MTVIFCGRKIRWYKPIRLNDLIRFFILGGFVFLSFLPRAYANDVTVKTKDMMPAYALVMALGMGSVSGPIEYSKKISKDSKTITSCTNDRRAPHSPQGVGYITTVSMNTRPPRPHMEE